MKPDALQGYLRLQPLSAEKSIPTEEECRALWLRLGVPDEVTVHLRMVAELARILAVYLKRVGLRFNMDLIMAGGYLHDLVKGPPDHAGVAERILRQMGYAGVSGMVLQRDPMKSDGELDEADLVFLAGHCIEEDRLGSFDGICQAPLNPHRYRENAGQTSSADRARIIRDWVEKLLGLSVKGIVRKHRRGILTVSVQSIRNVYLLVQGASGFKADGEYLKAQELPLCLEGVHQAEALRDELQDVPLSNIYCSDLKSAVETAAIVAEPHLLEPRVRAGLREINAGEWCGSASAEVHQFHSGQIGHGMMHFRPHGGETLFECTARVIPAFYDILNSTFGNMVIVGHPVVNRIVLCQVLGLSLERLFELDQSYGRANHIYCDGPDMKLKSMNGDDRPYNLVN